MISKVLTGHSFSGSIRYIMQDKKHARVLKAEGVRRHDKTLMIADFHRQQQMRPEKKQACFHAILSFYPGEKPGDNKIIEIAEKYLEGLEIRNTQVAIIKHTDKDHEHVHVIANMVDNDGKTISDAWIGLKGKKQAQQLTKQYKLTPARSKNMKLTHRQSLRTPERHQYAIYEAVQRNLKHCSTLENLEKRLHKEGITVQYKYKGQTKEKQGISFRLGEYSFKGSKIDRNFSLANLQKTLSLHQAIVAERTRQVKIYGLKNSPLMHTKNSHQQFVEQLANQMGTGISNNLNALLRPEPVPGVATSMQPKRKRKRRRLSL